ncbi:single-stranded DNA-binding protein [Actinomycetes bacterium KLBMP 9759]
MNETNVTIIGRVCSEITLVETSDGTPRASFRLASNERRFDRKTAEWVDGPSLFIPVTCWRRLATNVAGSLSMGDPVVVHGRMYSREFQHNGRHTSAPTVDAYVVGADLTWCTAVVNRARRGRGDGRGDGGGPAVAGVPPQRSAVERELEEVGEPEWQSGPLVRPSEREAAVSA